MTVGAAVLFVVPWFAAGEEPEVLAHGRKGGTTFRSVAPSQEAPPAPVRGPLQGALERRIASLVRDLGADRYDVRERATEALRRIGPPTIPALERAAASDDPEVRWRAMNILRDVRLGVNPGWPAEMVLLVRHFDRLSETEQRRAVTRVAETIKERAVAFLLLAMVDGKRGVADKAFAQLRRLDAKETHQRVITIVREPKNTHQVRALAWAYASSGRNVDALKLLTEAKLDQGARRKIIEGGIKGLLTQLASRDFGAVARVAHQFAEAAPDKARFSYLEAEALIALDKDDDAKALRQWALARNPDREAPHYTTAEMLKKLGRRRLAAREWKAILRVPPAGGLYDINAHLRLGSIYAECRLYERAAESLSKALKLFVDGGRPGAMIGGSEQDLARQIALFRRKAKRSPAPPDAPVKDVVSENGLHIHIHITVKDDKMQALRRALGNVVGTLTMNIQPRGLRIFDVTPATLRYDPEKREIVVLLNGSPCGEPAPFHPPREGQVPVAVNTLDCCYIFTVNTVTGEATKGERFEKDYTVRFQPGIKMAARKDVVVTINDEHHDWGGLLKGKTFDYLPKTFHIVVEGILPSGERMKQRFKVPCKEPEIKPFKGPTTRPTSRPVPGTAI